MILVNRKFFVEKTRLNLFFMKYYKKRDKILKIEMSTEQKDITSVSFFQRVKNVLYKARFYLGLVLIFIILNFVLKSKNFNYIVNRSEKGTLCDGILFDAQTYSYKSYKEIL